MAVVTEGTRQKEKKGKGTQSVCGCDLSRTEQLRLVYPLSCDEGVFGNRCCKCLHIKFGKSLVSHVH